MRHSASLTFDQIMGPDVKIGILQTGHAPDDILKDMGDYDAMFARLLDGHGFTYVTYDVVDGLFPGGVDACDGYIITGSKHGAYEALPWIAPLEQFIRDVYADGRPMVGICFGHQIIAQAMGGTVEKFENGWAVGRTDYEIEGAPVTLYAWHQDQVTAVPETAQVVGGNAFCENAALLYGDRIFTVQPHPEHTPDFVSRLIETRGPGVVPDPLLDAAKSHVNAPVHNQLLADRMAAFLKRGA